MSLTIPPAANFPGPLISIPARWNKAPTEGERFIPVSVPWGTTGFNAANCTLINCAQNPQSALSQIVYMSVDNTQCGADVQAIFPDTLQTYTFPAYSEVALPVHTGATQFYLLAPHALAGDVTNFTVHNSMPPPTTVVETSFQAASGSAGALVALAGSATQISQIVPVTVNGTLEHLDMNWLTQIAGADVVWGYSWSLTDGTPATLLNGAFGGKTSGTGIAFNSSDLGFRFKGGLLMTFTGYPFLASGGGNNAVANINTLYRMP